MKPEDDIPVFDLDSLVKPVARVRLGKKLHDVMPLSGRSYSLLGGAVTAGKGAPKKDQIAIAREVVRQVVPTLTDAELGAFTLEQLVSTIGLAGEQIERVQKVMLVLEGKEGSLRPRKRSGSAG